MICQCFVRWHHTNVNKSHLPCLQDLCTWQYLKASIVVCLKVWMWALHSDGGYIVYSPIATISIIVKQYNGIREASSMPHSSKWLKYSFNFNILGEDCVYSFTQYYMTLARSILPSTCPSNWTSANKNSLCIFIYTAFKWQNLHALGRNKYPQQKVHHRGKQWHTWVLLRPHCFCNVAKMRSLYQI